MGHIRGTKLLAISVIIIFMTSGIPFVFELGSDYSAVEAAKTIIVDKNGGGNYTSIQAAIDAASNGDTIRVYTGIYYETLTIDASISLIGNGSANTIINASGGSTGINVIADNVNITGFSVINSGNYGIRFYIVADCRISDCNISMHEYSDIFMDTCLNITVENTTTSRSNTLSGIQLKESDRCRIVNNTCYQNHWNGVYNYHYSHYNTFENNYIYDNSNYGMYITNSDYNTLVNNSCTDNEEFGLYLSSADRNNVIRNNISWNGKDGIYADGWYNKIENNNCSNNYDNGINVDSHCIIRNNTCRNNNDRGILAKQDNTIENNICSNSTMGINIGYQLNTVTNNSIMNTITGIYVSNGYSNTLDNNTIGPGGNYGIYINEAIGNKFTNNTMSKSGFYIEGETLSHWNTHTIDPTNKVNDKPVYYWKNTVSGIIPPGAGQVILANCSGVTIEDQNLSIGTYSIAIGYSDNNTINNNNCSLNTRTGLYLHYSVDNKLENNTCNSNKIYHGIWFYYSSDNTIRNNTCLLNTRDGVYLRDSNNNLLVNNTCNLNGNEGMDLEESNYNIIEGNNCSANFLSGIKIAWQYSTKNKILNNKCDSNNIGILLDGQVSLVKNNTCSYNDRGLVTHYSEYNNITENTFNANDESGITLDASEYNTIKNNTLNSCGLVIYGDSVQYWNMHTIGVDNKVNGKPLVYWKNATNGTVPPGAGQIILANCANVLVKNQNISSASKGIQLGFSNNNRIENNKCSWHASISQTNSGISIYRSSSNKIANNTCQYNDRGMYLDNALSNSFENNTYIQNMFGIYSRSSGGGSLNNIIKYNTFSENDNGIRLMRDEYVNVIHYNSFINNHEYGINSSTYSDVDAGYNWWGASSGPYHPLDNAGGQGDNVTDNVNFNPWLKKQVMDIDPTITTVDNRTPMEDRYYHVVYISADEAVGDVVTWYVSDNAIWLRWSSKNNSLWGTPRNVDVGFYWVNIMVVYGCGACYSRNFTINVSNTPPKILTSNIVTAVEDNFYFNDYASDDDSSGMVRWEMDTDAKWLSIDEGTGNLTGTPTNDDVGSNWVNVTVFDGNGGSTSTNFTINVINTNDEPEILTTDLTTVDEDTFYHVVYSAFEIDLGDVLTWTYNSNAPWLNWGASNHTLYGTPRNQHVRSYWVRINISDGNGGYDEHYFTITVNNTNDDPFIDTTDRTFINEDAYYEQVYTATDVDLGDSITWTYSSNAQWLKWGWVNHTLYGTPHNEHVGSYWVMIRIEDENGGQNEHNFTLTVNNTNDDPKIETIDITNIKEDKPYRVVYSSTDVDIGDTVEWSFETDGTWLNWGSVNNTMYGIPRNEHVGKCWVRLEASDGNGGLDEHYFIITVENTNDRPTILTEDVASVNEDEYYEVEYSATDPDIGDSLTWSFNTDAGWLKWGVSKHTLHGTPHNEHVGSYWVQVMVTDSMGVQDEHNFTLTVVNINDPPTITGAPNELTVNALEDHFLFLTSYIEDIDNTLSELILQTNSKYARVEDLKVIFNYPNTVTSEIVEITVSDKLDTSVPHLIMITVKPKDFERPSIYDGQPVGIDVPVATVVSVIFNEPMNHISCKNAFQILPAVDGEVTWEGNAMTFTPSKKLEYNTKYIVTINTIAVDLAGNNLKQSYVWNFTTLELDTDGDNIPNELDEDDDGDGYTDEEEIYASTNPLDPKDHPWTDLMDTDGDDIPDAVDTDDDNDGYSDLEEKEAGTDPMDKNEYPGKKDTKKSVESDRDPIGLIVAVIIFIIIIAIVLLFLFVIRPKQTVESGIGGTTEHGHPDKYLPSEPQYEPQGNQDAQEPYEPGQPAQPPKQPQLYQQPFQPYLQQQQQPPINPPRKQPPYNQ